MYNEEYKTAFISDLELSDASKKQYITIFNSSGKTEMLLNKDLFDMTFEELELVFYKAQYKRVNSLINYISTIKAYITWSKDRGYGLTKDNPIIESISEQFVSNYLYNEGTRYFTRDELIEGMENLINVQHKALALALFEGIRGLAFSELRNLRYEDLTKKDGKYYAHVLSDEINLTTRIVEISEELFELFEQAFEKKEMYSISGKVLRVADGEYIFRKNRVGAGSVKLTDITINTIIGKFIKEAFGNNTINANYIYNSGMMYKINNMMNEDRILTKELAGKIIEEYDLGIQTINGKAYPVYANLRRIIDEDFIREAYGDFTLKL